MPNFILSVARFQFQYGSIKSHLAESDIKIRLPQFQFQYGSIKR